jgi:very-short-patch-repair endonuclease
MDPHGRTVEAKIARIARSQHGVVTRVQLLEAGLSAQQVRSRVQKGALLPVHRGVYRVGHLAPSIAADYMAAVLACGAGSLLSGLAAGRYLGLLKGSWPAPRVTTPTERRIEGIRTRRTRAKESRDAMTVGGIAILTVPEVLVDLAGALTIEQLARACHEAGVRYRTTPAQVESVLSRRANSPGARNLLEVMHGGAPVSLSQLERRFNRIARQRGYPLPKTNRVYGAHRVDCRWPEHRLTVELDSYRYHNSRYSWEQDRQREREARMRGDEFRRFTYGDVFEDRTYMLRELDELLPRRA